MREDAQLPRIYVDISQPGDRGNFLIKTSDWKMEKELFQNKLPENISEIQYLYTARLLENRSPEARNSLMSAAADDSWKRTDRYQDIVRYGQKLYSDLFGAKGDMQRYVKKAKHLQGGVQYVLRLHSTASELWNIPWEYLHDGEKFIAIEPTCNIVRSVSDIPLDKSARELRQIPRPLRVLVMIADPQGVAPLNVDQEVQNVLDALKTAVEAGLVTVDIVEEGSIRNLELMLTDDEYHILHYTGHGGMSPYGSFLALEDDDGGVKPALIHDLLPIIRRSNTLRLVILSGCQTGQIDETQAMSGIATGLLEAVPAVVAMQFSVLDASAQIFARTFFERIGRGVPLERAIHTARSAMNNANPSLTDWGVPALYVQRMGMRLVDPELGAARLTRKEPTFQLDPLPQAPIFVGRRNEQRELRQALPNLKINTVYIWGMWGIGKSALARRALQRPGRKGIINDVLIIPCDKTQPADILKLMAAWFEPHFPEAAQALRNPQLPPEQRIQIAAQHVKRQRMVMVLDRFDAYLQLSQDGFHYEVPNPKLESFISAIATAPWSVLTIFTSRYRWRALNTFDPKNCQEIHLNTLAPYEVGMMFARLDHLKKLDFKMLGKLIAHTGGHPATIHQFEGIAKQGHAQTLENVDRTIKGLVKWWGSNFFGGVLNILNEVERNALMSVCVLDGPFWAGYLQVAADLPSREAAEQIMVRWEAHSLAHFVGENEETGNAWYEIHELVRSLMLHGCSPEQLQALHRKAAKVIELDLYVMAEDRYEEYGGRAPNKNDTYLTARMELRLILECSSGGFGVFMVRRALDWRQHFIKVGDHKRASELVLDTWAVISQRYNEHELARELLQETIENAPERDAVIAKSGLAQFLSSDGKLDEALQTYDDCYRAFMKIDDLSNAAVILTKQAFLFQRQNKIDKAIKTAEQALKMRLKGDDFGAIAESLRQLSSFHSSKDNLKEAIKYIQQAEAALSKTEDWAELMLVRHVTGTLYKKHKQYDEALECFQNAIDIAQRLGIPSQIGSSLSEASDVFRQVGRLGEAARMMLDAISLAEQTKDKAALAMRLYRLALIYEMQKNKVEAQTLYGRALELAKTHNVGIVREIQDGMRRVR